ncbi:hypothetical protein CSUI_003148 [Cystoisospora suis]|uniref:Uncharacterized protein n=1 Tax=Cystoisospora suis TaxID=483139 RepID=A0A2C6L6J4_9APIC|nr:hypothetical protein CSUI_003148 [Cystoisospora suis]
MCASQTMPSPSLARGLFALRENGSEGKGKAGFSLQTYGEQVHGGPSTFTSSQDRSFIPRSVTRSLGMSAQQPTRRANGQKADYGHHHSNTGTTNFDRGDAVGTVKGKRRSSTTRGFSTKRSLSSSVQKAPRNTAVIVWLVFTLMAAGRLWKCRIDHWGAHHPVPSPGESTAGKSVVRRLAEGGTGGGRSSREQQNPSSRSPEGEAGPSQREDPSCRQEEMTLERMAARVPPRRPDRSKPFTVTNSVTAAAVKFVNVLTEIEASPLVGTTHEWSSMRVELLTPLFEEIEQELDAVLYAAAFSPNVSAFVVPREVRVTRSRGSAAYQAGLGLTLLKHGCQFLFEGNRENGEKWARRGLENLREAMMVLQDKLGADSESTA